METLFLKIVSGEIPSKKIYEDEFVYAFLDIQPKSKGHTLVIPKKHFNNIEEFDTKQTTNFFTGLQNTIEILKNEYNFTQYKLLQNCGKDAGQEVMHLHFHIIPYY